MGVAQEGTMTDSPNPRPVAVLDDDVQFIRMVERILGTEDIPVQPVTTPDLDEAVSVVAMTNCRAALVDIYIYGEVAGFELVERLRAHPATADLPLIVTSGAYREIARHVPFLQQHRCSILPKPFEIDALLLRLTEGASVSGDGPTLREIEPGEATASSNGHQGNWLSLINPLRRAERTA
jgi:DNA-binding response OmpR family regulator